jgi:hypothetical protein
LVGDVVSSRSLDVALLANRTEVMKMEFSNLPGRINQGVDEGYEHKLFLRKMKIRLASTCVGVVIALAAAALHGQTSMRYLSIAAKGGPAPAVCAQEGGVVKAFVGDYPHPAQWTWIVACDESDWKALMQHLGVNTADQEIWAETDRHSHITYVRGYALLHPLEHYDVTPEHVIAHELVHAYLDSGDEEKVDSLANKWIKDRAQQNIASASHP